MRRLELDQYKEQNLTLLVNSGTVFDAAWAMALALNHTAERVARNDSSGCSHLPGQLVPLEQFDYSNERMGCVMKNSYSSVKFAGITVSYVLQQVLAGVHDNRVQFHLIMTVLGISLVCVFNSIECQVN